MKKLLLILSILFTANASANWSMKYMIPEKDHYKVMIETNEKLSMNCALVAVKMFLKGETEVDAKDVRIILGTKRILIFPPGERKVIPYFDNHQSLVPEGAKYITNIECDPVVF